MSGKTWIHTINNRLADKADNEREEELAGEEEE